jgi:hypothetical protein
MRIIPKNTKIKMKFYKDVTMPINVIERASKRWSCRCEQECCNKS